MSDRREEFRRNHVVGVSDGSCRVTGFFVAPDRILTDLTSLRDAGRIGLRVSWPGGGPDLDYWRYLSIPIYFGNSRRDIGLIDLRSSLATRSCFEIDLELPLASEKGAVFSRHGITSVQFEYVPSEATPLPIARLRNSGAYPLSDMVGSAVVAFRTGGVWGIVVDNVSPEDGFLTIIPLVQLEGSLSDLIAINWQIHGIYPSAWPKPGHESFGAALRQEFTDSGTSPAGIARTVGVSVNHIYDYLAGRRLPAPELLRQILTACGTGEAIASAHANTRPRPDPAVAGHVFLSYVREDAAKVDRLQQELQNAGIPVWRDKSDLWPGEDWQAKIREAITDNTLVFIACFSSASLARVKSYQNEELALAFEQLRLRQPEQPWLIPIRFDDCEIPDRQLGGGRRLSSLQWVDLFGDIFDDNAERLVAAVQRILGPPDGRLT